MFRRLLLSRRTNNNAGLNSRRCAEQRELIFALDSSSGSRLRRVFPIQDHYLARCSRLWPLEAVVVLKLLLAPGRRIAVPVVFYRAAQDLFSGL
jgi:hypothetical protein